MPIKEKDFSVDFLRQCFHVDFQAGVIFWNTRPESHFISRHAMNAFNGKHAGLVVGSISGHGYRVVRLSLPSGGQAILYAHRIIWALHTGEWPVNLIDHKNGNRDSNEIENLRNATKSQNVANAGPRANNKCGAKGVYMVKSTGRYAAEIKVNGKRTRIGTFDTIQQAADAYIERAKIVFGEFAHA